MRRRMGECLVQAGLITDDNLRTALAEQKRTGERLGIVLTRLALATDTGIAQALASQLGLPFRDLAAEPPDPLVAGLIPRATALKHAALAVSLEQRVLTVAMSDPLLFGLVQDLARQTGHTIKQVVATRSGILAALVGAGAGRTARVREPIGGGQPTPPLAEGTRTSAELLQAILSSAIATGASDVHVEPTAQGVVVRERVDGVLRETMQLPTWAHDELVATFKRMAGMDVRDTRLPQAGRLRHAAGTAQEIDLYVSSLRTLFGEKLVLRRRDHASAPPSLDDLGLSGTIRDRVLAFLSAAHGLVLIAGPAGSGAQATLAGVVMALAALRRGSGDIVSVEDPIEYQLAGVTQLAVDGEHGEAFAARLESAARQHPDVLVIGELRDTKSGAVTLQAAARSLVVATVGADDLPSAVRVLGVLGLDGAALASMLVGVVVQRMVRRLCTSCRRSGADAFFESVGCDECHHTGYRGRVGVYQAIAMSEALRAALAAGDPQDLDQAIHQGGAASLAENALALATSGVTTLEEIRRVVGDLGGIDEVRPLCAACGAVVSAGFVACPACGRAIGSTCVHCGRALQPGWRFCPYCARRAETPAREREGNRGRARTVLS